MNVNDAERQNGQLTLTVSNLAKSYDDTQVIESLSLEISTPEFVTVLGPSGCGKTTLLRCVAGLESINRGQISLGGQVLNSPRDGIFVPPHKRGFGMVFQSYALWPHMSVYSNVSYPLRTRRSNSRDARVQALRVLELVGLAEYADRSISQLSGGQQQRVALARAMVADPKVMLFDEPLSNIDAALREELGDYIVRAHKEISGLSLYVTHDQAEALHLSDRVVVMIDGAIQQVGSPEVVFAKPANERVARFFGFENIMSGTVVSGSQVRLGASSTAVGSADAGGIADGADVAVAFRSESIRVDSASTRGENSRTGVLRSIERKRRSWLYRIDVGGELISARVHDQVIGDRDRSEAEIGGSISFHIDPDSVVVFEQDS